MTTTNCRDAGRRRPRGSQGQASVVPIATVEDYLAGRCDRLGTDLLLDADPALPQPSGSSQTTTHVHPADPDAISAIASLLQGRRPDVVWLLHASHAPAAHLAALAALTDGVDAVLVALEDDPDAEALLAPPGTACGGRR